MMVDNDESERVRKGASQYARYIKYKRGIETLLYQIIQATVAGWR